MPRDSVIIDGPLLFKKNNKPLFGVDIDDVIYEFIPQFDKFLFSKNVPIEKNDFCPVFKLRCCWVRV